MNPMEIIQMIRNGKNPQQITMNIVKERFGNTPLGTNLLNLAEQNNAQGIEQVARNLMQSRGLDFDKEFAAFKQTLGL